MHIRKRTECGISNSLIYYIVVGFVDIIVIIIMTSYAPISSKIKLSGSTKPRG